MTRFNRRIWYRRNNSGASHRRKMSEHMPFDVKWTPVRAPSDRCLREAVNLDAKVLADAVVHRVSSVEGLIPIASRPDGRNATTQQISLQQEIAACARE